jgi:hypothetical protein
MMTANPPWVVKSEDHINATRPVRVLEGLRASKLLEDNTRLVAYLQELPIEKAGLFPPSTRKRGRTLSWSTTAPREYTSHRHVFAAEVDEVSSRYNDVVPNKIFADKVIAEAVNEDDAQRDARRLRNQNAPCRRNAAERQ